eukprot:1145213-Pelagomonas_calceolata.AAC.2
MSSVLQQGHNPSTANISKYTGTHWIIMYPGTSLHLCTENACAHPGPTLMEMVPSCEASSMSSSRVQYPW